jgi:RNA polymerase sigma factor (sigma-70 family)
MTQRNPSRLSRIKTRWTMVYQAHRGVGDQLTSAQKWLLLRYYRSAFRYLRALVRDVDVAEELTQEFVVRFLRGDFKRADPTRGRFRDLLKRALRHLAIDYWRHKRVEKERMGLPISEELLGTAIPNFDTTEADRTFLRGWRAEMLGQAWRALARFQQRTRWCYYTVLRFQFDHKKKRASELAQLLSARLGKPLNENAFRQLLSRARQKFADLLVTEVARSLATTDPDAVTAELIELNLLSYCRRSLARLRQSNVPEASGVSPGQ